MCQQSTSASKTPVDMPEWREMLEQIDCWAKQSSQMACVLEDLKCWRAWDTTCWHKAKDTITPFTLRREAWKKESLYDLPWKDKTGPLSVRETRKLSKATLAKLLWDRVESIYIWTLPSADTILNWTEFSHKTSVWQYEHNIISVKSSCW